jgi:hypothetical protein
VRALVFAAFAVAAGCDLDASPSAPAPPPAAPRPQPTAATKRAHDDCRDACDQSAILTQASDDALRACRANCDGRYGVSTSAPHEVPSKITRAPAVHRPPAPHR